jgi:NADH-quinone oxidoreductase subunit H
VPKQIRTFEDFIKHVLWLVFWIVLLTPLIGLPIYYFSYTIIGVNLLDVFALITTKPEQFIQLQLQLISQEPTRSIFLWTAFPGFTFAAIFSAVVMIYIERKFVAKIQLRVGPQYAGRFEGFLQSFADLFKLLFKEIIIPYKVDKLFFWAVPFALVAVAGALIALLPLSPNTYIANPPVGAVVVFAIIGFSPIIALLAGWASNSKYSFLGGLRALHQMVAYEIPMILSIVGIVALSGTLNLMEIVNAQAKLWYILLQPLGAIVFFIAALAELERIPFDLPEADSELVAGWQTEYSGMLFGVMQLATYIKFYALAGLFTVFFLGGWYGSSILPPEAWFIIKTFIVMLVMMIPRGIMPRVRIDLLLRTGWVKLMLLTFLNIFMAMFFLSLGVTGIGVV